MVTTQLRNSGYMRVFMQVLQQERDDAMLVVQSLICTRLPFEVIGYFARHGIEVGTDHQHLRQFATQMGKAATRALLHFGGVIDVQASAARMLLVLLRFPPAVLEADTQVVDIDPEVYTHPTQMFANSLLPKTLGQHHRNLPVALLLAHRVLKPSARDVSTAVAPGSTETDQINAKARAGRERRRTSYLKHSRSVEILDGRGARQASSSSCSCLPFGFDSQLEPSVASCALLMLTQRSQRTLMVVRESHDGEEAAADKSARRRGGLDAVAELIECVLGSASQGDIDDTQVLVDSLYAAGASGMLAAVLRKSTDVFGCGDRGRMESLLCACNAIYGLAASSREHCVRIAKQQTVRTSKSDKQGTSNVVGMLVVVHKSATKGEENSQRCSP